MSVRRFFISLVALLVLSSVAPAQALVDGSHGHVSLDDAPAAGMFLPVQGAPGTACVGGCGFDPFAEGAMSSEFRGGMYFSGEPGPKIPTLNYVPMSIRTGVMLSPVEDHWWGRGNFEFLCDFTGAAITSRYGSWFAGPSFFMRGNWVEPGSSVVPYNQFGVGCILNDAYRDPIQQAIGQMFEFYLHWELGAKCFIAPNLSLDVEGGLQHISNGGLAKRNYGMNAFGATIGFTYYFPWGS